MKGNCRKGLHVVMLVVVTTLFMLTSTVSSNVTFESPLEGDIVIQKAVTVTGTASAASSVFEENDYDSFDMGSKVNFTLTEDPYIALDPYIGNWKKGNNNPVIGNGASGSWNETGVVASSAILDGATYKIWGEGLDGASVRKFGLWTSANGNTWTGSASNPIFTTSGSSTDFDYSSIRSPWVIKDGATYKMWYSGKGSDGRWRIGYATSADGVSWTRGNSGNPVLDRGNIAKFDGGGVAHPSVIKDGQTFRMWYAGVIEATGYWQIGYATSADGTSWTRQNNSNPVVGFGKKGGYTENGATFPRVVKDGSMYHMWFMGVSKKEMGYAWSSNGIMWSHHVNNPIIKPGQVGSFDESSLAIMAVMKDQLKYRMWLTGISFGTRTIGSATADIQGLEGIYTSKPYNAGDAVTWGKVSWSWAVPQGTTGKVETRTSPDQSSWTDWVEVQNNTETTSDRNKFFQYKVTMDTADTNIVPKFYSFSIEYREVLKVEVSLDNASWFIASGTDDWDIIVTLVEGNNTIYVKVTDTTPYPQYANIKVRVDTTVPSGHLEIDVGNTFTNTATVVLSINAQDIHGVEKMRFGNYENLTAVAWEDYATTRVWDIEAQVDGVKTVFVEFMDKNGLISRAYSDTIILDSTPPVSSMLINENATFTSVTEVQLGLKSTDKNGINRMRVSTNENFDGAIWDAYLTTLSIPISEGDGEKTVHAEFEDMAGLTTVVSDTIILDTVKPTGSVEINDGEDLTRSRTVDLDLWADDLNGIKDMMVSNYPDFVDGVWEDFSSTKTWELPNNIGDNLVYARFRDNAGLVSDQFSDSIFLHTNILVGGIEINEGEELTRDPLVSLEITLRDLSPTNKMMVSNNANFGGASWRDHEGSLSWNVSPSADGEYFVYVKFKDKYDIESDVYSDSIRLDRTDPEVNILSPTDGLKFKSKNGTLQISGSSYDAVSLSRVEVSIDGGPWVQMQNMMNWSYMHTFTVRGTHTIRAKATDTAGNTADTSVSIMWPEKKQQTEPGFEGILVLGAIAVLVLLQRRRQRA